MAALQELQQRVDGAAVHCGTLSTPRTAECVTCEEHSSGSVLPRYAVVVVVLFEQHDDVGDVARATSPTHAAVSYRSTSVPSATSPLRRGRSGSWRCTRSTPPVRPWYVAGGVPQGHGTMVPMVPWYGPPPPPGGNMVRSRGPSGPRDTRHSLCGTEGWPRKTTGKRHFLVTFWHFLAPAPNKTESISQLFTRKADPTPNKLESKRSGFAKPDLGIHAQNPENPVFLTKLIRGVG